MTYRSLDCEILASIDGCTDSDETLLARICALRFEHDTFDSIDYFVGCKFISVGYSRQAGAKGENS